MDKMFKQKMNQEQKMYGQAIGCGCGCSVNVSVCVQGWVVLWPFCVGLGQFEEQGRCRRTKKQTDLVLAGALP